MPVLWFAVKVLALVFGTFWLRASLPRMRYDQLMALGWKYLIEIAILWVLVSVAIIVAREEGWNVALTATLAAAAALAGYGVLWLAMPKPGEQVEEFR
jgi:NADH-quinone oxidoreductase subunit H